MSRFLSTRLVESLAVLALMSFIIYGLIGLMPGDPIDVMIASNPKLTAADAKVLRAIYGLDRPIIDRYLEWLGASLRGDFGYSRSFHRPVFDILGPRLLNTVLLLGSSSLLAILIAIPLGMWAALRAHGLFDEAINLLCFAGVSVPSFWLALVLILVFAVGLGWLPAGGMGPVDGGGLLAHLRYMILPVTSLTIASLASFTRFMRASMLDALRQDYVRTARAKGASPQRVVLGHALRNAMLPVVTIIALDFGALFSGALVTETMFAYLGMGKMIYDAIIGNDFNLALVGLLFATLVVLVGNFFADVGYVALDPRVSFRSLEEQR
ncbi:MAG: ABC transporter permease [Alphaproteobacteria bacterium]|nr:ABC transporter permease [Alphaproteobacteria bacterium]